MAHTVTAKLNKDARKFENANGTTFFVSVGEKNYDYKAKENKWTNYEAALFAKDAQVGFYESALVEGSIVSITGSGIIVDDSNRDYAPKLVLQDAKLEFVSGGQSQGGKQQQAPSQQQKKPAVQQAPDFDFDDDAPF